MRKKSNHFRTQTAFFVKTLFLTFFWYEHILIVQMHEFTGNELLHYYMSYFHQNLVQHKKLKYYRENHFSVQCFDSL